MTAASTLLIGPQIKVQGTLLAAALLDRLDGIKISRALRLPGRAVLKFSDEGYTVAAGQDFTIGTEIEISAPNGTAMFLGEVTGIELQMHQGQPEFRVVVDDPAYKMTLGTKVRTFTQVSYSEVIQQIAQEYGLQVKIAGELNIRHTYLMQADSDFGFISEIAERTGSDWWMTGKTLVFQPVGTQSTAVQMTVTEDLDTFSVQASALHPGSAAVCGWWPMTKQSVRGTNTPSQVGSTANLVQPFLTAADLKTAGATISAADVPGDQAEAEVLANRMADRWTAGAVTAKGRGPADARVEPGSSVSIVGAGPASGTYHVSEVEHSFSGRGFHTSFTAGDRRNSGLVDMLSGGARSSFRRDGLVVGIVTMVGNSQGSAGDVKVKYTAVGDQVESNWARVVTLGAGAKRGMTFLPEINDEVLVGFEGGDARRPVILGGLYNGKDVPAEFGVQNNTVSRRRITSRLGHFIEFGDGTGPADQHIDMLLSDGKSRVRLGQDNLTATVPAGTPVSISSGESSIKFGQDGSITIAAKKVVIKSETDVEISAINVTAKASVKAAISGTMVEVKGSATNEVSSGGAMTIKGAMVAVN